MVFTPNIVDQNSFDERFPCDNPGLGRISYVNFFQDTQNK